MSIKSILKPIRRTLIACALLTCYSASAEVSPLDRVIAIAENDVILESELNERMTLIYENLKEHNTTPPPKNILAQQVLERLIIENLQIQRGHRAGVRIDDNELNSAMGNIARQNGLSIAEFRAQLEQEGIDYAETRAKIRKELIIQRVQQGSINSRIKVTDQEVDNFLISEEGQLQTSADFRLAHIMLAFPIGARSEEMDAIETRAEAIYQEILSGGNFQQIAVAKSTGQNALKGGDLGWRKTSQLPSIFAAIAPKMKLGELSKPIRSGGGYHLVKLMDKRGGSEQVIQQTKVRHILLKPNEIRTEIAVKETMSTIRKKIIDGTASFASLAKEHSDDHGSAVGGGDLGWMNPGQLVPAFQEMMDKSKVGTVSPAFQSQYGWHILEVLGRRDEDMSELVLRNRAKNIIHRRKFNDELQNWVREIRDESFVDIKL